MSNLEPNPTCTRPTLPLYRMKECYGSITEVLPACFKIMNGLLRDVTKILQMLQNYYAPTAKCYEKEINS